MILSHPWINRETDGAPCTSFDMSVAVAEVRTGHEPSGLLAELVHKCPKLLDMIRQDPA
eukprot:CAMPEP_0175962834 /NCGR_PEP_ID=MMETSP0108-20121206/36691_1 /TAXON_ID=195067 ORGANISM="Goniomonas pacifica, Strain CCMP1869" /NCGR_SAMPLE_ID=MMETSP0108 /ASSEMBLY_ACC=CAM_ASM_000204 /LENGTH=58 /DNA_ID=CAMNT_0017290679 /DNA_START=589 /DNA_END=765 /DNA_ORIENTATION=-